MLGKSRLKALDLLTVFFGSKHTCDGRDIRVAGDELREKLCCETSLKIRVRVHDCRAPAVRRVATDTDHPYASRLRRVNDRSDNAGDFRA